MSNRDSSFDFIPMDKGNSKDYKDTTAFVKSRYLSDETTPTIPSDDDVVREKNWVDHGSKL